MTLAEKLIEIRDGDWQMDDEYDNGTIHRLCDVAEAARACYENDDFITDGGQAANNRDQVLGKALAALLEPK